MHSTTTTVGLLTNALRAGDGNDLQTTTTTMNVDLGTGEIDEVNDRSF